MARKTKAPPEMLRCRCGVTPPVCIHVRGEGWKVICLNVRCDVAVRGFSTAKAAIEAWNKEVMAK